MRVLVPLLFLLIALVVMPTIGMTMNSTNSSIFNSTQVQNIVQKIPAPPPNLFIKILNFSAQWYNLTVKFVQENLQSTILKEDPSLANTYANIIAWLISLTAIYIVLTFIEVARKFIGFLIAIGWTFVIILLLLAR
jgi:3-methyladenine DNA glycosylase AlkC